MKNKQKIFAQTCLFQKISLKNNNKFKQFPAYSGRQGRGSRGWFIYPTLRQEQKNIVAQWTRAFNKILDKWGISGI